jgi:hypothetical protein
MFFVLCSKRINLNEYKYAWTSHVWLKKYCRFGPKTAFFIKNNEKGLTKIALAARRETFF